MLVENEVYKLINHILLEVYCIKKMDGNAAEPCPSFCPTGGKYATYQCLLNKCKYVDFTSCEDTLCYIGEESDELFGISYGGDMEIGNPDVGVEEWKEIAISKVKEAYAQFMEKKHLIPFDDK